MMASDAAGDDGIGQGFWGLAVKDQLAFYSWL